MMRAAGIRNAAMAGAFSILVHTIAWAQGTTTQVEFATSPSPVGSGARAAGMANAFIAVADDATAASWNPAGLMQLELPEVSLVYAFNRIEEDFLADSRVPEVEDSFATSGSELNFASVVYPFMIGERNFSASVSYQRKFDFNREIGLKLNDASAEIPIPFIDRSLDAEFEQSGGLGTLTPSLAVEVTRGFSLGASFNVWRSSPFGQNDFDVNTTITDVVDFSVLPLPDTDLTITTEEKYDDFHGQNFVFGALWNVNSKWNLGVRVESGFSGEVDYELDQVRHDNLTNTIVGTARIEEDREISFPWTYAAGAAWRVNDKLTLSLDASFTDYDDFFIKLPDGTEISLVDGHRLGDPIRSTKFDTTQTYRFGWEYVMIPKDLDTDLDRLWTLRGGLFYDQEPASNRDKGNPNSQGDGNADQYYGITGGIGLLVKQRVNLDLAYQYRWGNGVRSDTIGGIGIPGFEEDIQQHRLIASTVIYFGGGNRTVDTRDYESERMK